MSNLVKDVEALKNYLIETRREFHQNPELSLKEFRTASRIEEELTKFGIKHSRVGETGVLGILKGDKPSDKVLLLRADIDALPINEVGAVEYISKNPGVMHACGHDAHTTCLLAAAKILSEKKSEIAGEVRFVFQPAEEIGKGTQPFIEANVLEGVDRVFGLHCAPDLPLGTVGLTPKLNNAAVDHFTISVKGVSSHVSLPHKGVDALYVASEIVVAVQALRTRLNSPLEPMIIGIGKFNAGTTYNALAANAVLEGTTRTISKESRAKIKTEINRCVKNIAEIYGATATVEWEGFTGPVINDPEVCEEVAALVDETFGKGHVVKDREISLGGDNFADFIEEKKGAYAYLGTSSDTKPCTKLPLHSDSFDLDEEAMLKGTWLHVAYALWFLA
ncbi:MAG: amidohydrolase [Lachnospiraceae bacterium]|nr:MAG: amidohydrolase [Lachnospiraceae bacterium]